MLKRLGFLSVIALVVVMLLTVTNSVSADGPQEHTFNQLNGVWSGMNWDIVADPLGDPTNIMDIEFVPNGSTSYTMENPVGWCVNDKSNHTAGCVIVPDRVGITLGSMWPYFPAFTSNETWYYSGEFGRSGITTSYTDAGIFYGAFRVWIEGDMGLQTPELSFSCSIVSNGTAYSCQITDSTLIIE